MDNNLEQIKTDIYDKIEFEISNFWIDQESKEYDACQFELNGRNIISRNAKVTPKKVGQFVTCWKRRKKGQIKPFHESDSIDFYAITVRTANKFGQFVFPKSVLIEQGIISTDKKEGKRGFRVYPYWDIAKNKQAILSQEWQLDYFYEINELVDLSKVLELYKLN